MSEKFEPVVLSLPPSFTPSLVLEILPHGLTIHRLFVRDDIRTHDPIVGPELPRGHAAQKYANSTIGRYANRVPVGTHALERHGIRSNFSPHPNENEFVSLHGGPIGFDALCWTLLSDPPSLFSAAEISNLTPSESLVPSHAFFRLISASGDQGYPGKLVTEALIALIGPNKSQDSVTATCAEDSVGSIVFVYRSRLDEGTTKVVTPVNLTQRWGFNLNASLQDRPSVENHVLTINADRIAELGPHRLATGNFIPTSTLPSHDHSLKRIGDKFPPGGYDHYYAFTNTPIIPTHIPWSDFTEGTDLLKDVLRPAGNERDGYRALPVVELSSAKSGFKVVFDTNQYGVMFHTTNIVDPSEGAHQMIYGRSNNGHAPDHHLLWFPQHLTPILASVEFHQPPMTSPMTSPKALLASLNNNTFNNNADAGATLLTSDELYHNYVRCDVRFTQPGN